MRDATHCTHTLRQTSSSFFRAQTELLTVAKERDSRLADSKQFQQLKGLMQRKNAQLAELRAKLARYEPEAQEGGEG